MKKMITIALMLAFSGFCAETAHAAVSVRIPVLCKADEADDVYIAKMETLDDTLLETIREGLLYLKDTESGDFVMEFTEPGNYHYRVLQDEEASSDKNFDKTAFAVDVYVSRNDDGTLVAEPVVYEVNGDKKETAIRFLNMPREYYEKETESETDEPETETDREEMSEAEIKPEPETDAKTDRNSPGPSSTSVRTLDQTPVLQFAVLLLLSGAGVVFCVMAGRRRKGARRR